MRIAAAVVGLLLAVAAHATTVKELVRIRGQGESVLRGVGLVTGLPGTGDSGKELVLSRPLAELLKNSGNAIGTPKELASAKSVALVNITCVIPAAGARADDTLDVTVSTVLNASSLKGGELYLVAMEGPRPDPDHQVFAFAQGLVELQDSAIPTLGKVRHGARMIEDVLMPGVGNTFDLIIDAPYAGWGAARQIASSINANAQPQGPAAAVVWDDRTIRVTIPEPERADKAGFVADVMASQVNQQLLDTTAQVICNSRTGSIVISGDVEISPVAITQKDLTITTVIPTPTPTALNPVVDRTHWAAIAPAAKPAEMAKLTDLIRAFKQLDVPVADQINLLEMLHNMGKLHAKLIRD